MVFTLPPSRVYKRLLFSRTRTLSQHAGISSSAKNRKIPGKAIIFIVVRALKIQMATICIPPGPIENPTQATTIGAIRQRRTDAYSSSVDAGGTTAGVGAGTATLGLRGITPRTRGGGVGKAGTGGFVTWPGIGRSEE